MDASRNTVLSVGLDRLFHEIVKTALSSYGWRVLDPQSGSTFQDREAEIVLVSGVGPLQEIVNRLRDTRGRYPASKIVLLGVTGTDNDMVGFIEEGASAYVSSSEGLRELAEALQMVLNNQTPSSGRITQLVFQTIRRLSQHAHSIPEARLTLRENEIFRMIQEGLSNKEIANRLLITPNTVKNHVHHLLEKLRVRNRHEAAWLPTKPARALSAKAATGTGE